MSTMLSYGGNVSIELKSFHEVKKRSSEPFQIFWRDLKYIVTRGFIDTTISKLLGHKVVNSRMVLEGISGVINAGEMVALMGPSGAGKTTFLECLMGKRETGLSGEISAINMKSLRLSIIPQTDCLFPDLTFEETMMYAAQLSAASKCATESDATNDNAFNNHLSTRANSILKRLQILYCSQQMVSASSSSERKRLSVAIELLSSPNVLFLDEPTTGLDSVAAKGVVELLQTLVRECGHELAVVVTIHQPSQVIFDMFNKVYLLSNQTGTCIYDGSPSDAVELFAAFDYVCPEHYNIADYIIEVAAGDHGKGNLKAMAMKQVRNAEEQFRYLPSGAVPLPKLKPHLVHNFTSHVWTLSRRMMLLFFRNKVLFRGHLMFVTLFPVMLAWMAGRSGEAGGCLPRTNRSIATFNNEEYNAWSKTVAEEDEEININVAMIYNMMAWFLQATVGGSSFTAPFEITIMKQGFKNNSFTTASYYAARTFFDLVSALIECSVMGTMSFFLLGIQYELWRLTSFLFFFVMTILVVQNLLWIIAAYMSDQPVAVVFVSQLLSFGLFLPAGFLLPISSMSSLMVVAGVSVHLKYCLGGLLITTYGFDRCGVDFKERFWDVQQGIVSFVRTMNVNDKGSANFTNFANGVSMVLLHKFLGDDGQVRSQTMKSYELHDDDFGVYVLYSIVLYFLSRMFGVFAVTRKFHERM